MIRYIFLLAILLSGGSNLIAQFKGQINETDLPILDAHYQSEYTFDKSTAPEKWQNVQNNLNVSFGSTDVLYFRTEVPDVKKSLEWSGTGWRGERLNAQVILWSADSIQQIRFEPSDLRDNLNNIISKEKIRLDLVRYVISNYPYGEKNFDCGPSGYKDGFLMPDRFEKLERFDLPQNTVRPVWVSFNIPENTPEGVYKGIIKIKSKHEEKNLKVTIKVQGQTVPKPTDWEHVLDLWQNPWVVAWHYQVEPWSEEHKMLLKRHLKPYADAGGKYITTYAVHSPWSDNSYMIEGGMIEWIKSENGKWKFDYSIFDEYVELAMEMGINKAITLYTPIPWGNRFRYLEEKTGNYIYESWSPETETFNLVWNQFLDDLQQHLKAKGWFDITYLGINENPMPQTLAAIKVIKNHPAKWRITYAGDYHPELNNYLDDYSYLFGKESSMEVVKNRKAKGFNTTFYVCCNPPFPNNLVFSPPIEGRWLSWYTAGYGYNGFLRWAYDAWPEDPNRDARHGSWAAGDCFLIYPGGESCIRFEKLREGIVDFEKISIIRKKAALSKDKQVNKLMLELESHLLSFTKEKGEDEEKLKVAVAKGQSLIASLSELLKD